MKHKKTGFFSLALAGFGTVLVFLGGFAFNFLESFPIGASKAFAATSNSSRSSSSSSSSNSSSSSSSSSNSSSSTSTSNSTSSTSSGSDKVTICHIPPGNPGNAHAITISMSALQTHQDHHNDHLGACSAADTSSGYSDGLFRIKFNVPVKINPAQNSSSSTDLTSSNFASWTAAAGARASVNSPFPWPSGYASGRQSMASYLNGAKDPRGKTLAGYPSFGNNEDMPALMLSGGVVDLHSSANISGVVYTSNFVEIEQKDEDGEVQYINGALIGGNGIYLESNNCGGGIGIVFDPDTTDSLNVNAVSINTLKKKGIRKVR